MKNGKIILLGVAIVLIIGSIYALESRKNKPAGGSAQIDEIRIEEEFAAQGEDTLEIPSANTEAETLDRSASEENASITSARAQVIEKKAKTYERAKEIISPDHFINTDGIALRDVIGEKIILIDFWTYSCINCQRTTPYLNSWHEKYADDGLVIIGIHTPEFEFEKELDNVSKAAAALGIEFPVVLDNDYSTWGAYRNRYWPRKYLIDIDGFIVYDHIGEGAYDETEKKIVEAINEKNRLFGTPLIALDTRTPEEVDEVDFSKIRTRESYFGSTRIEYIVNLPAKSCYGMSCEFSVPDDILPNHFALEGAWKIEKENAVLLSEEGSIHSNFTANQVNLVAGSPEPVQAKIYLDGKPIPEALAGSDVEDSMVTFGEHTLYNLVDLKGEYGTHTLEIRFLESDISAFAFTFG